MKESPPLRRGRPVWYAGDDGRSQTGRYPSLRGHRVCDVAIVGGGMTGALIAETFAAEGISVSVLERGSVGCGSTVASSALLLQETDKGLARPVRRGRTRNAQFTLATSELRADFEKILPTLHRVGIEHAWEGLFAMTPDSLPYIGPHRRYPRHLFALGYGGNGMTFASLAARLLLEHWQGVRSPDQRLFSFGRLR